MSATTFDCCGVIWHDCAKPRLLPETRASRVVAHETHVDVTMIAAFKDNIEDTGPQARPLDSIGEMKQ